MRIEKIGKAGPPAHPPAEDLMLDGTSGAVDKITQFGCLFPKTLTIVI